MTGSSAAHDAPNHGGPEIVRHADSISAPSSVIGFDGRQSSGSRAVAVETPVQVSFGGVPFGVMMLTPGDLADFAYGFSLTEGVIDHPGDIRSITEARLADGLALRIVLSGPKLHAHLARKRAMSGRTSCGLCGIEDLAALPRASVATRSAPPVQLAAIDRALRDFDAHQPLNAETRAVHGAAWSDLAGQITHVREDVGRHNALDKLIGALLLAGVDPERGFLVISSRASFEMVEKAAKFGARTLVAISAPTSLAIERARGLGLTLIGIARRDSITVFEGAETVVSESA